MTDVVEIGAARASELDPILELMCEAFEMPLDAARKIYYSDPYLDPDNKRVVRVNGRIVSCLTIIEMSCWIGRAVVRIGGIAGVATATAYRRRGFARSLLIDTLHSLCERGFALTALFPFSRDYYRRLGWETCSSIWRFQISSAQRTTNAKPGLRPARPTDLEALSELYNAYADGRSLFCLRDHKRWRYLIDTTRTALVFESDCGRVEGYLLHDYRHGSPALGMRPEIRSALNIKEMVGSTEAARQALIAYLGVKSEVSDIEWGSTLLDLETSGILDPALDFGDPATGMRIERCPSVMVRTLDFRTLLNALRPNWTGFSGNLLIQVDDPILAASAQTMRICGDGTREPEIVDFRNSGVAIGATESVKGDVGFWSQVVTGYISGAQVCLLNSSIADDVTRSALTMLFPKRTPFLPPPDHF